MKWIKFLFIIGIFILSKSFNTVAQDSCKSLDQRPWRGISCLHCLHKRAPGGAVPITRVLKTSCIDKVMIAFVVDGSFGWSLSRIINAMNSLATNGRQVWIHLYVYNGPAQRRWRSKVFSSFAMMDPAVFRYKMLHDPKLQAAYQSIVKERIVPILEAAKSLNIRVSVAPGLEDNLDAASFQEATKLLFDSIPEDLKPELVRSPCYDCSVGNGRGAPSGTMMEEHTLNADNSIRNGIIHTDGEYFRFAGDSRASKRFPLLSMLETLLKISGQNNNGFLLWVSKYQDAPPGFVPRSPEGRKYRAPTKSEGRELVQFLRS